MTRPLKRESVIDESDVALRERDVGTLGPGYLTLLEQAVGMKLLRPTVLDQIRVRNLNSKRVIKARVTGAGQVEVAM
ncbi:hypothetical protein WR25_10278 [Diploscapter pachys]|uniref:Flagella basal body P-ring formation protein FlgA SAF domain-containing protein n=1 Tax=Diploscapter pachys TaxID=2018661 RepID=A0A2A2K5C3_9BILA|nr:hypothetical protein WR25_10278 [Diploscapter pachys]